MFFLFARFFYLFLNSFFLTSSCLLSCRFSFLSDFLSTGIPKLPTFRLISSLCRRVLLISIAFFFFFFIFTLFIVFLARVLFSLALPALIPSFFLPYILPNIRRHASFDPSPTAPILRCRSAVSVSAILAARRS